MAAISEDRDKIAEFCRKHRIRRLALFGSVLRPDVRPDSDVDVLVETRGCLATRRAVA